MKIRISTKAGLHDLGVTFLQTNFAPILDLDQHFMRDTVQTGPTPGFTYFPHRSRTAEYKAGRNVPSQRHRSRFAAVLLFVEHHPRRRIDSGRGSGKAERPGRAGTASAAHVETSQGRSTRGQLCRTVAEPARFAGCGSNPDALSGLRRSFAASDETRSGAAVRQYRSRGPKCDGFADCRLHFHQREAGQALRYS